MKYKVGDKVRIRKDLKFGSGYGDRYVTAYMEKFSNKVVTIKYVGEDYYGIEEDDYCDWTDEMIEGLAEENKPKLKLIDILNKIANGELKEGTKIKLLYDDTIYELYCDDLIREEDNRPFFDLYSFEVFREEVELIEPQEPTDNTKIEELEAMGETKFEYGEPVPADWVMANKINEIIRYINK